LAYSIHYTEKVVVSFYSLPTGKSAEHRMPTTSFDVGVRAGVSTSTVSRLLNGGDRVHADKARRKQEASVEPVFRLQAQARALVTRRGETVGLPTPHFNTPFLIEIARGVIDSIPVANHDLPILSRACPEDDRLNLQLIQRRMIASIVTVAGFNDISLANSLIPLLTPIHSQSLGWVFRQPIICHKHDKGGKTYRT
jgi:DNA-binding LacI/PurR family transcriptional regulator